MPVLFFDIGGTLADVTRHADGTVTFTPASRVIPTLGKLTAFRNGVISNPGDGPDARALAVAALAQCFSPWFDEPALLHWGPKDHRAIFDAAVASAAEPADQCVFIGEDALECKVAREAGMLTAPHPVFALAAAERRPVCWAKLTVPPGATLADLAVAAQYAEMVPLHVPSERIVLAMATELAVSALHRAGFAVDLLGEVGTGSAYLLRDDRPLMPPAGLTAWSAKEQADLNGDRRAAAAFSYVAAQMQGFTATVASLGTAPGGVYVCAEAGVRIEEIHIPGAQHGHTERLLPDLSLLELPGDQRAEAFVAGFAPAPLSSDLSGMIEATITADLMRSHIGRLSGAEPIDLTNDVRLDSRHIEHPGNALAVHYVGAQLAALGFPVRLQEFAFRGARFINVEAEYLAPGAGAMVLITAHLDSTASLGHFEDADGCHRGYAPWVDPAPGADDDASGVAAVLGAAQCLRQLLDAGKASSRSIRFVLFNAEEQGLLGSKYYARAAAQAGDRIAGVLQMDMIGGFQGGARKVEIHAGCAVPGPAAAASNQLADAMEMTVKAMAPDLMVQRLTGPTDPATGRSDHASFHERGWAAVAVSENFFPDTEPATGTRQYHLPGDTLADQHMNTDYAAAIARAVAGAGLALAGF